MQEAPAQPGQRQINALEVPPDLRDWFGRLGGQVIVQYQPEGVGVSGLPRAPYYMEGKLRKVAATGAFVTLAGVAMDDGSRRTLDLPLDRCKLMPKNFKGVGA